MADVQHAGATKLLSLIVREGAHSGKLTYSSAALEIWPDAHEKHARAVAQMCDLLDAAACLAGVPLLALVAIRARDGEVNPKAWVREYAAARSSIIDRSLQHSFQQTDFDAVSQALTALKGLGNRKAWDFVKRTYGDLLYRRLIGDNTDQVYSALDDLGTDDPARAFYSGYSYLRDPKVRAAVMLRASGACEFCGESGFIKSDGTRYLETHHVIALADDGADRVTNVIALCASDHRKAHFSADRASIETQMIGRLRMLNSQV